MKYLALDIGQCCIRLDRPACFAYLGYGQREVFPEEMEPVFAEYEKGFLTRAQFLDKVRTSCGRNWTDEQLLHALSLMLGTAMPGMAETIAEILQGGHGVAFFSDASEYHHKEFYRQFPAITGQVPDGVYSYEVGTYKPDPKMYEAFEQRFGIPVLYTDDKPQNIAGACQRGWSAWQFSNIDDFRRKLAEMKLI